MANSDQLKRRTFLTAGSAAGLMLPALADTRDRAEWPQLRPSTIHVLFIGRSGATTNAAGKTVQYLTWGAGRDHEDERASGGPREETGRCPFRGR